MTCMFHVTPRKALDSILALGLEPRIGPRAESLGEIEPAIYLFPSGEQLEHALCNWLPEEFPDDEALALLQVQTEGLKCHIDPMIGFEATLTEPIAPERLTLLTEDVLALDGKTLLALIVDHY